nr:T7SS effector LXG polymorphic toxin [Bacillus marasmi]
MFRNIDDIISLDVFSSAEFDHQMYLAEKERKDTLEKVHELDIDFVNLYQKTQPAESYAKLLFQQLLQSSTKNGIISPIHFNTKAYHSSEIYRAKKPRSISKDEFENIQHKLAYKVQIIDEYEEYGGDFYVFDNGQIVRKYSARVKGKFVTRYEIVEKIPKKDRTGGMNELGSSYEGTPLEPLEYLVNPKSLAIKGGKKLFGKGVNDIGERLSIKLEKPELSNAWAHSGYGENFLHIKKSDEVSSRVVNKGVGGLRDDTKGASVADDIFKQGKKVVDKFNLDDAYIKPKHLSTTKGNRAKFLGDSKGASEQILKDSMKNGTVQSITDNGLTKMGIQSYSVIIDAGKTIGTKGENLIKVVLSEDGGMLSAYPIK